MRRAMLLLLTLLLLTWPGAARPASHALALLSTAPLGACALTSWQLSQTPGLQPSVLDSARVSPPLLAASESVDALQVLKLSVSAMKRQDSLLTGYKYLKTVFIEQLDKDLSPKKSETRLFEVTSVPNGPDVEVLIAVDGTPLSEKEKQKRRAEQEKRSKKEEGKLELSSEELLTMFEWTFAGEEHVNGRPSTILTFRPKAGAVYKGSDSKMEGFLRNVRGRAWVDEEEKVISRIEFESLGPVKSLGGVLWTLHSFRATEERGRLPEGVWIDTVGEYFVDATALFFKQIRSRSRMNTHDYEKPASLEPPSSSLIN
ncbi:MAG: hypothetical protein JSW03_06255 [Candidatus Eiseniibacteriota bacterium]|nr:MAG: hypothetical protein JSW03_06255 [Candidatus Eisenbacteria bacterium]